MRVLVVDDDPKTLDLFSTLLRQWGHEVEVLENPSRAEAVALELVPDIAFLDLAMPQVDGWEVAQRLRQHRTLDKTFLAAVSGYGSAEDWAKSQAAGFDAHLLKPVEEKHLQLLLRRRPFPAPRQLPSPPSLQRNPLG